MPARLHLMPIEYCQVCGFDGSAYTDHEAIEAVRTLPDSWTDAIKEVDPDDLQCRPIDGMWSIAEYSDHIRETAFSMRFVLDTILTSPGTTLGELPEPRFDPQPRLIDSERALSLFSSEIAQLIDALRMIAPEQWDATCTIGSDTVDIHWIARHIVHDVTHHLADVARLRGALHRSGS